MVRTLIAVSVRGRDPWLMIMDEPSVFDHP